MIERISQSEIEIIASRVFERGVNYALHYSDGGVEEKDALLDAVAIVREELEKAGAWVQRKRVAHVECPRGTDRWDQEREKVQNYLPSNYTASCHIKDHGTEALACIRIEGYDRAGWTLDAYVIPRLASGLIVAKEIK